MANVISAPKEIAGAAKITLEVVDHLVGYAKQLQGRNRQKTHVRHQGLDPMKESGASVWIIAFVGVLILAPIGVSRAADCQVASGDFTAVRPQSCSSPVGICTHGTLRGGFPSTYDFVADTLAAASDPDSPNKSLYTGHSVITTSKNGQLFGRDTGFLFVEEDGRAPFVTTVHVVGGTRQYAGASGQIVAPGVLDLAKGTTDGTYTAVICDGED